MIFITFSAFLLPKKTSVPSVYVKTVTLDKLQKYNRIPNGAESGFLSYSFDTFCLLRTHVFCKGAVTYHRIALTDAERTEKMQKMFIRWRKSSRWR